jgi:hypothetical protein
MAPSDTFLGTACRNSGGTVTELTTFNFLQNLTNTQLIRIFQVFDISQNSLQISQHPIAEPCNEKKILVL